MRGVLVLSVVTLVIGVVLGDAGAPSNVKPPQVYVYTRNPVEYGKKNQLLCHCTDFHPPRIELQLKKGDSEMPDCNESDMTFKEDWAYYLTKHADFIPEEGVEYSCNVRHNDGSLKTYRLDPLM